MIFLLCYKALFFKYTYRISYNIILLCYRIKYNM